MYQYHSVHYCTEYWSFTIDWLCARYSLQIKGLTPMPIQIMMLSTIVFEVDTFLACSHFSYNSLLLKGYVGVCI